MKAAWTEDEDEILRDAVAVDLAPVKLLDRLPGRTIAAIRSRIKRIAHDRPLGAQPHCRQRSACRSSSAATHCRSCIMAAAHADTAVAARRRENLAAYHARPETKAKLAVRMVANASKANERPAEQERRRQQGRRLAREVLCRPDVRAANQAPEVRKRAGLQVTETRLAGIPAAYRDHYRHLVRIKRFSAEEARAQITEMAATAERRDARRAITDFDNRQRARAEREREQAY